MISCVQRALKTRVGDDRLQMRGRHQTLSAMQMLRVKKAQISLDNNSLRHSKQRIGLNIKTCRTFCMKVDRKMFPRPYCAFSSTLYSKNMAKTGKLLSLPRDRLRLHPVPLGQLIDETPTLEKLDVVSVTPTDYDTLDQTASDVSEIWGGRFREDPELDQSRLVPGTFDVDKIEHAKLALDVHIKRPDLGHGITTLTLPNNYADCASDRIEELTCKFIKETNSLAHNRAQFHSTDGMGGGLSTDGIFLALPKYKAKDKWVEAGLVQLKPVCQSWPFGRAVVKHFITGLYYRMYGG